MTAVSSRETKAGGLTESSIPMTTSEAIAQVTGANGHDTSNEAVLHAASGIDLDPTEAMIAEELEEPDEENDNDF